MLASGPSAGEGECLHRGETSEHEEGLEGGL